MFSRRQYYFSQLARSYPILKLVDIYDRQSFVRAYVLDNIYVCALMYVLFYVALWYARKAINRIHESNMKMWRVVEQNRTKLNDVVVLKSKKREYEEAVVKVRDTQKVMSKHLENEVEKLSAKVTAMTNKLSDLQKLLFEYKRAGKSFDSPVGDVAERKVKCPEGFEGISTSLDDIKCNSRNDVTIINRMDKLTNKIDKSILEPSFPPPPLPEPPPRKYGIFVTRPPGQRRATPTTPPSKIGFK